MKGEGAPAQSDLTQDSDLLEMVEIVEKEEAQKKKALKVPYYHLFRGTACRHSLVF